MTGVRRSDLDWMRFTLVLAAFLLACWAGKAPEAPRALEALGAWLSPLFFVVSAGSAWHALEGKRAATFVVAKVLRLFVPLVVCTLALAVGSLAQIQKPSPSGELPGAYLWYLPALLLFSLLWLPLLLALRRPVGRRFSARLSAVLSVPGILCLLGVVPAAAAAVPRLLGLTSGVLFQGWGIGFHFAVFSLGCLVFSVKRLQETIVRQRGWLVIASALLLGGTALGRFVFEVPEVTLAAMRALGAWSLSLTFLGIGIAVFTGSRPVPAVLRDAALPFYMLGLPSARFVSGRLAGQLAGLPASGALKYLVVVIASFAVVSVLYVVVRRLTLLRFLFGLSLSAARTRGAENSKHTGGSV